MNREFTARIRRRWWWIVLTAALVASCGGNPEPQATFTAVVVPTDPAPIEVRTIGPQTETAADCVYPQPDGSCTAATASPAGIQNSYPAPGGENSGTPAASLLPQEAGFELPAPAPFNDCTRTPGIVGCDPEAPAVRLRLAFVDALAGRLVSLDLEDGTGWQIPVVPLSLEMSPASGFLLAGLEGDRYAILDPSGNPISTFTSDQTVWWQPGGALGNSSEAQGADGRAARLERDRNQSWSLRVTLPDRSTEQVVSLEGGQTDQIFSLRGWIPGTDKLLGQVYYAGNAAQTVGGQLAVFDAITGTVELLEHFAPVGNSAEFAWQPGPVGYRPVLAFLSSAGGEGRDMPRLALLDFSTGQVTYPLPDGISAGSLAWRSDGERLAFSVSVFESIVPESAAASFPGQGIYILDPQAGVVENLTLSPGIDGWPVWSPDTNYLLFVRLAGIDGQPEEGEMRARDLADGREWVIARGVSNPEPAAGQRHVALGPK